MNCYRCADTGVINRDCHACDGDGRTAAGAACTRCGGTGLADLRCPDCRTLHDSHDLADHLDHVASTAEAWDRFAEAGGDDTFQLVNELPEHVTGYAPDTIVAVTTDGLEAVMDPDSGEWGPVYRDATGRLLDSGNGSPLAGDEGVPYHGVPARERATGARNAVTGALSGETLDIQATRAFLVNLATHVDVGILAQLELCRAHLDARQLDPTTLGRLDAAIDDFKDARDSVQFARVSLGTLHSRMEEAVNATPHAATSDFYRHQ